MKRPCVENVLNEGVGCGRQEGKESAQRADKKVGTTRRYDDISQGNRQPD